VHNLAKPASSQVHPVAKITQTHSPEHQSPAKYPMIEKVSSILTKISPVEKLMFKWAKNIKPTAHQRLKQMGRNSNEENLNVFHKPWLGSKVEECSSLCLCELESGQESQTIQSIARDHTIRNSIDKALLL
jgi:hypothetical protein